MYITYLDKQPLIECYKREELSPKLLATNQFQEIVDQVKSAKDQIKHSKLNLAYEINGRVHSIFNRISFCFESKDCIDTKLEVEWNMKKLVELELTKDYILSR